jgi:hypothetical protein
MKALLRSVWCVVALFALASGAVAQATEVDEADAHSIRSVIEAQIAAFLADDAPRAFSYAAPEIRAQMGSPERFVAMVRTSYPVVYRPASVSFLPTAMVDGMVFQPVQMIDVNGSVWLALYALQRQPDKNWRISGCVVRQGEGKVI